MTIEKKDSNVNGYNETKKKIIDVATRNFAIKGYTATSMRDIANEINIKMASLYYYYDSKESLLEEILTNFMNEYSEYFKWLSEANSKAETLEEVIDNIFSEEFIRMLNPKGSMGMAIAMKEQFTNEMANSCICELFYKQSIENIKNDFDRLIRKGVIPPSDTRTIAMLFVFSVMISNGIRVQEFMGSQPQMGCTDIYVCLKKYLTSALKQGGQ